MTELEDDEFIKRLKYRDLLDTKIDVRAPCPHCDGRGMKGGEPCPVCDGDKVVTQSMSLYAVAQKMKPLLISEIKGELRGMLMELASAAGAGGG